MGATRGHAKHLLHHPLPLFAVRRHAAKDFPYQQMRQLVRHYLIDERLLVFQQQHRIEANFPLFQPGGASRRAALLIDQRRFGKRALQPVAGKL